MLFAGSGPVCALLGPGPTLDTRRAAPLNPEQMIARLKELESQGITQVTCSFDGYPHELALQSIALMGRHVIPQFGD